MSHTEASPGRELPPFSLEPAPPPRIGPYLLVELLGRGAMGEVWLAEHEELGSLYALKLVSAAMASDPDSLARFQREVEATAQVDRHPAIVRIHASGVAPDGRPWYAMEYVEGRTLRAALRDGLPREAALDALEQVADGLAFAHARGLVHRDVKPDNILLPDEGGARLTDFGLARVEASEQQDRLTRTGEVVGTPAYMAPEQLSRLAGQVGPATDVWGLGAILYELLAGSPPYAAATSLEIYAKLTERAPITPPSRLDEDVPPALEAACLAALRHDPLARPRDAGVWLEQLRAARRGEGPAPRRLLVPALGGLALASLALAAGALVFRPRPAPDAPAPPPPGPPPETPPPPGYTGPPLAELQAQLLAAGSPPAHGLRLLACAGLEADARAAARAATLLEGPGPALAEARARAAVLAHDPVAAAREAATALLAAPGEPAALRAAALARAAALEPEVLRLERLRIEGQPDQAGETALAAAWEQAARELSGARAGEPDGERQDTARLVAARAWSRALEALLRAGRSLEDPSARAASAAGLEELAPLLSRVPREGLLAARTALARPPAQGWTAAALEEAEARLAERAAAIGPRPELVREAARVALGLGGPESRAWAEVWLALAGDLPARAALALERFAREGTRQHLDHARRLDPHAPLVLLEGLLLEVERVDPGVVRRRSELWLDAARLLAGAPEALEPLLALLQEATLSPPELARTLEALPQDERDGHLARALARLHVAGASLATVRDEAARASLADPACAAAYLLEAQALRRGGGDAGQLAAAMACVAAAAPLSPEPALERLRRTPDRTAADYLPLLARGYVTRLPALLQDDGRELPRAVALVVEARAGGKALDWGSSSVRGGLVTWFTRLPPADQEALDLLGLVLRLERSYGPNESWEEALERLERALEAAPQGTQRLAARAFGLAWQSSKDPEQKRRIRVRAALAAAEALVGLEPAGGLLALPWRDPVQRWTLRGGPRQGADAQVRARLPDAPELGWTWLVELRRPELLRFVLLDALLAAGRAQKPAAALLSARDLADPWGRSRVLVLAAAHEAAQRDLQDRLLEAGELEEAQLAFVRGQALEREDELAERFRARLEDLARSRLWIETPKHEEAAVRLQAGLLAEAQARWGDRAQDRAQLAGLRADLLLWRAGRAPDPATRQALLEEARQPCGAADPALVGKGDHAEAFWAHWRRARLHGALGEAAPFAAALAAARQVHAEHEEEVTGWRLRAVGRDPLRPVLEALPGYAELLAATGGEEGGEEEGE